jgi:hypothetical protein
MRAKESGKGKDSATKAQKHKEGAGKLNRKRKAYLAKGKDLAPFHPPSGMRHDLYGIKRINHKLSALESLWLSNYQKNVRYPWTSLKFKNR